MRSVIIGTRGSSLAMCQAQIVQTKLEERVSGRTFQLQTIKAQADKNPELSLTAMTGEGVFVKELEAALLDGRIDLAVHSMKDLPLDIPSGLRIAAVLEREEPRDAFVSRSGAMFDQLPNGSRIGTSSLRRRSQLLHRRRDLQMLEIRGNVDTRLRKLEQGQFDAILLAACGMQRLGLSGRISEYLDPSWMLPEPGQGALAIETRTDDSRINPIVAALDHTESRICVEAERAFLERLGGGCRVPIAAYAVTEKAAVTGKDVLKIDGAVVSADGRRRLGGCLSGAVEKAHWLGKALADELLAQGARELLD